MMQARHASVYTKSFIFGSNMVSLDSTTPSRFHKNWVKPTLYPKMCLQEANLREESTRLKAPDGNYSQIQIKDEAGNPLAPLLEGLLTGGPPASGIHRLPWNLLICKYQVARSILGHLPYHSCCAWLQWCAVLITKQWTQIIILEVLNACYQSPGLIWGLQTHTTLQVLHHCVSIMQANNAASVHLKWLLRFRISIFAVQKKWNRYLI